MSHDNGSSLVGENIGLTALLKREGCTFFDLKDPCHGLNLVLRHSLEDLPSQMMDFINFISNHFSSPQRKAQLKKIQEENGYNVLFPKKLALTRWLSVGNCLTRIIEIWASLAKYFEEIVSQEKSPKQNRKKIVKKAEKDSDGKNKLKPKDVKEFLNDEVFYIQIILLSYIVDILNKYNVKLQNQQASISELKRNI